MHSQNPYPGYPPNVGTHVPQPTGAQPQHTAPAGASDMLQYTMPSNDDFDAGSGQQGPDKPILRIGGKKPTYPGVFAFDLRAIPVGRDPLALPGDPAPRAKVKVERHFWQLPNGRYHIENCPIAMRIAGARCLVCEKAQEYAAANPIDQEHVKKMKPRTIIFMWVINRADPGRGPVIHEGHWSFDKMYGALTKDGVNPFDPLQGVDFHVQAPRPNSGERWEYRNSVRQTPLAALPNGQPDHALISQWISQTYDLSPEAVCKSYEDQLAAYNRQLNASSGGGHGGGTPPGGGYATHAAPAYVPQGQQGGYAPNYGASPPAAPPPNYGPAYGQPAGGPLPPPGGYGPPPTQGPAGGYQAPSPGYQAPPLGYQQPPPGYPPR